MVGNVTGLLSRQWHPRQAQFSSDPPLRTWETEAYLATESRHSVEIPDTGTDGTLNVAGHIDGPLAIAPRLHLPKMRPRISSSQTKPAALSGPSPWRQARLIRRTTSALERL